MHIEVAARNTTADRVDQIAFRVPKEHKRHLLVHLFQNGAGGEGPWQQALVFTRTKHGANRLAQQLEAAGISAAAIHGNKSQAARVQRARRLQVRPAARRWWPPKSPRAASTSRNCRRS